MGYTARLELRDAASRRWVGQHMPAWSRLDTLFQPILEAPNALDGIEGVLEHLPEAVRVRGRLGPKAAHLELPSDHGLDAVVLKWVPPSQRGPVDALVHLHEGSRARRAVDMAHRLRAHGVQTPRPVGYLERASRPRAAPSLHVSEWVPAPDLRAWWTSDRPSRAARRAALARLGAMLRTLHAQGLFHADLHAENVLVAEDGVHLLDLESIRTVARAQRVRLKGFARLVRDADELGVSRADRLRVLRAYVRHAPDPRGRWRSLWTRVEAEAAARRAAQMPPASEEASADL